MLLNLFDLFLTGYIFRHHGSEANGVAIWFLKNTGLWGFVAYKFCLVIIVVLACEGISIQSIRKSRIVITAGCLVYLFIVFWECFLILTYINGPKPIDPDDPSSGETSMSTAHRPVFAAYSGWDARTNTLTLRRA